MRSPELRVDRRSPVQARDNGGWEGLGIGVMIDHRYKVQERDKDRGITKRNER